MTEELTEPRKRRKGRSPGYPGIPLGDAIERVRTLYEKERRHPVHVEAVLSAWGQKPKSGAGLVAIAALLKFGLLESEGVGAARRLRVSEEALDIIRDQRSNSPERLARIKAAALRPTIHAELWDRYGGDGLPSDETLRHVLVFERDFTESGAREFIQQFRATVSFAQLAESDSMADAEEDDYRLLGETMAPPNSVALRAPTQASHPPAEAGGVRMTFPLPVSMDAANLPVLQVPIPMTEKTWEQMLNAISILKVTVVRETDSADDHDRSVESLTSAFQ